MHANLYANMQNFSGNYCLFHDTLYKIIHLLNEKLTPL